MKPNELRIDNYVEGYNGKVFQWSLFDFATCNNDVDADEIGKPIPLTEEWLLKFGAEKENTHFKLYEYSIWNIHPKEYMFGIMEDDFSTHFSTIKYVHQLQNLYFALTGEELKTIN